MALVTNMRDGVLTIQLGEKFDFDYVEDFREVYTRENARGYVVDFRNTEYMDSSGLGMLLNMRRYIQDPKVAIRLVNCRPQVKKILLISRFESKFDIG